MQEPIKYATGQLSFEDADVGFIMADPDFHHTGG